MQSIKKEHKTNIEKIRKDSGHILSAHAFSSLYLWQDIMKLSLYCEKDFFVLKCGINGENAYFFPCGKEERVYDFICQRMQDKSFIFCYMREEDVKWLEERFPNKWEFRRKEECDEYIGDIQEYIALQGSKFSEIRRKIRKIDKEYQITSVLITDETIEDAMNVVSKWNSVEHSITEQKLTDEHIAERALQEKEVLDVSGIILYANGQPVCVFAGFPLSEDTIDVVIGKTSPNAPKGITYYGLREYLKMCGSGYIYCNHEEDLGISGIRQMKKSLSPIFKIPIWEAVLK